MTFYLCTKRPTVNLDLTRHPTLLVKVDNAAVSLAPRTQIHSSSLSDVGLAGVGFRSADQNIDTRQQEGGKKSYIVVQQMSNITPQNNV